jgi:small subunit ribosomal protein S13
LSEGFRHIIRIAGTDLDGSKKLVYGLSKIRGVDVNFALAITKVIGLDPDMRLGFLSDGEVQKIEGILKDPASHGIPAWMLNRPKDLDSGKNLHLTGPDLALRTKSDIDFMIKIRCWKGIRHSLGLKVRGQRTRTTGRGGRAVGVRKKGVAPAAATEGKKSE